MRNAHEKLRWQSKAVLLLVLPWTAANVVLQSHWWFTQVPSVAWTTLGISAIFGLIVWKMRAGTAGAALTGALITASLMFSTTRYPYESSWLHGGLMPLLAVFVLTWGATKIGRAKKERLGTAESKRGRNAAQVAANLGVAALVATSLIVVWPVFFPGADGQQLGAWAAVAALAEAAADTVSTEIGQVYGGRPRLLTTFRAAEPGTDGAITLVGTLAGIVAAAIVGGVAAIGFYSGTHCATRISGCDVVGPANADKWFLTLFATVGGSLGLLFDSLLGATLERTTSAIPLGVARTAEKYLDEHLGEALDKYRQQNTSGGTLAVSSDAARELLPGYATPAERTANNSALGPASSRLAAEVWRRAIEAGPTPERFIASFLTGSIGSGKTSSFLDHADDSPIALISEGMMDDFGMSVQRIERAIEKGFTPTLSLVFADEPRTTLRRAVRRAMQFGRPAPIEQMAKLYVAVPGTVAKIAEHFGGALGIAVFENSIDGKLPKNSTLQNAVKATGAYTIEKAKEAMQDELDKLRNAGEVSHEVYLKFRGTNGADDSARGRKHRGSTRSPGNGDQDRKDQPGRAGAGAVKGTTGWGFRRNAFSSYDATLREEPQGQAGWLNNDAVNFLSTLSAPFFALLAGTLCFLFVHRIY